VPVAYEVALPLQKSACVNATSGGYQHRSDCQNSHRESSIRKAFVCLESILFKNQGWRCVGRRDQQMQAENVSSRDRAPTIVGAFCISGSSQKKKRPQEARPGPVPLRRAGVAESTRKTWFSNRGGLRPPSVVTSMAPGMKMMGKYKSQAAAEKAMHRMKACKA
jgi:hypothetical protein